MAEGTWVGLDVHARKIVAGVLDAESGELRSLRAPTLPAETVAWLERFSAPVRVAFEESYGAALQAKTRRDALDQAIVELAAEPPFAETVGRLCCLRGVSTLTALALTVELGDWTRFRPQSLGPFLGLTPSGLERRAAPPRRDHQDRQHARAPAARGGRLAPAAAAARERDPHPTPPRTTRRGSRASRPQRTPAPPALARPRAARQAAHDRRGRRRARTRQPLLGARDHVAAR